MMENEAKKEYDRLTLEELKELNFTGDWELDRKRFTREYEKNLEVFNDLDTDYDYGSF